MKDFISPAWFGILGPARMHGSIAAKLRADIWSVMSNPDFAAAYLVAQGLEAPDVQPSDFGEFLLRDRQQWRQLMDPLRDRLRAG